MPNQVNTPQMHLELFGMSECSSEEEFQFLINSKISKLIKKQKKILAIVISINNNNIKMH